jgi:uncharacterized protein YdaU (DUF1376 family)
MAKDPAFLFYPSDFLTGTQDLDMEEIGIYITLLCLQHQKGHLTEKMIRLCRGIKNGIAPADVMAKFMQDENGNFYNERLEEEKEKRAIHSEKQSLRAIEGWKKRKKEPNNNNATAYTTACAAAMPLEDVNVNRDINVINNIIIDISKKNNFEKFWNLYDKKVGDRNKIEKKFNALSKENQNNIFDYIPKYIQAQPEKRYRKNPDTFLNQKGWNDEIIPSQTQTISKAESAISVHNAVKMMLEEESEVNNG